MANSRAPRARAPDRSWIGFSINPWLDLLGASKGKAGHSFPVLKGMIPCASNTCLQPASHCRMYVGLVQVQVRGYLATRKFLKKPMGFVPNKIIKYETSKSFQMYPDGVLWPNQGDIFVDQNHQALGGDWAHRARKISPFWPRFVCPFLDHAMHWLILTFPMKKVHQHEYPWIE